MEKLNAVSKRLGVSKGKIKDMCKSGEITFKIVNGIYYVDENEVKQKLEENPSNIKSNESLFDDKFHICMSEVRDMFMWLYHKTNDSYFKRKSDLCKDVMRGEEDSYTLGLLYDFIKFQYSDVMRLIKNGDNNNTNLKFKKIYEYIQSELEKPTVDKFNVININPQNNYIY